jgi:hypothetical protein
MRTSWNDAEDRAMDYLPHLDQVIYLRGIRRRMDYRTGIAGVSAMISYDWLSQLCEVHPRRGSNIKEPSRLTKEALRAVFARLEVAGLIQRLRDHGGRGLVFRCLLADLDDSVQMRSNPSTTPAQPQQHNPTTVSNDAADGEMNNPSTTHAAPAKSNPIPVTGRPEEERRDKSLVEFAAGDPDDSVPLASPTAQIHPHPVREIFEYWQRVMAHPRAILNNKRQRVITARLREGYRVPDIKRAIDGCQQSAWHQGKNPDHKVFDDIELICRDGSKLEQFQARLAEQCQQDQTLDDWLHEDERGVGDFIDGECRHV